MSMTREPNNLSSPPPPQPPHRHPPASNMQLPSMSSLLGIEPHMMVEHNTSRYQPQSTQPNTYQFGDTDRAAHQLYHQTRPSDHFEPRYLSGVAPVVPIQARQISVNPIQYEGPTAQRRPPKKISQRKEDPSSGDKGGASRPSMVGDGRHEEPGSGTQLPDQDRASRAAQNKASDPTTSRGLSLQNSLQKSLPMSNLLGTTSELNRAETKYTLVIRQQPESARACGYGERDRRVVDPPPILTLEIEEPHGRPETYVVHCVLWNADTNTDASAMPESNERKQQRRLMGTNVASPFPAKDENNEEKIFFTFPDVSVRTPGTYRLKFNLCVMDIMRQGPGAKNPVPSSAMSAPFQVFNAKDFGGMQASSALTKSLKAQGCLIPVKKGNTRVNAANLKNRNGEENEDDEDEEMDDVDDETTNTTRAAKRAKK